MAFNPITGSGSGGVLYPHKYPNPPRPIPPNAQVKKPVAIAVTKKVPPPSMTNLPGYNVIKPTGGLIKPPPSVPKPVGGLKPTPGYGAVGGAGVGGVVGGIIYDSTGGFVGGAIGGGIGGAVGGLPGSIIGGIVGGFVGDKIQDAFFPPSQNEPSGSAIQEGTKGAEGQVSGAKYFLIAQGYTSSGTLSSTIRKLGGGGAYTGPVSFGFLSIYSNFYQTWIDYGTDTGPQGFSQLASSFTHATGSRNRYVESSITRGGKFIGYQREDGTDPQTDASQDPNATSDTKIPQPTKPTTPSNTPVPPTNKNPVLPLPTSTSPVVSPVPPVPPPPPPEGEPVDDQDSDLTDKLPPVPVLPGIPPPLPSPPKLPTGGTPPTPIAPVTPFPPGYDNPYNQPDNNPSPKPTKQTPAPCTTAGSCNPTGQAVGNLQQGLNSDISALLAGQAAIKAQNTATQGAIAASEAINQASHATTHGAISSLQAFVTTQFTNLTGFINNVLSNQLVQGAIQAANTGLLVHNAAMLSRDLAYSFGAVIDNVAQAVGINIKDADGNQISPTAQISQFIGNATAAIVGQDNLNAIGSAWKKASTIYSSAANVWWAIREVGEQTRELTELAIENTGRIGNALRESGVVYEDSYPRLTDTVNPMTPFSRKFQQFQQGVYIVEETLEPIEQISSSVIGLQQSFTELNQSVVQFQEEIEIDTETKEDEYQQFSTDVQSPDISEEDLLEQTDDVP